MWFFDAPGSDHPVDITDTFDRKLAALAEHRSQTGHVTGLAERLRGYLTENAPTAGLPDGRLAELFTIVRTS
jgi:LmbE family N-acetylglucosaminyl deacetylase